MEVTTDNSVEFINGGDGRGWKQEQHTMVISVASYSAWVPGLRSDCELEGGD